MATERNSETGSDLGRAEQLYAALCDTCFAVEDATNSLVEAVRRSGENCELLPDGSLFQPRPGSNPSFRAEPVDHEDRVPTLMSGESNRMTRLDRELRAAIQQTLNSRKLLQRLPEALTKYLGGELWVIALRQDVLNGIIGVAEKHFRHGLKGPDANTESVREIALRGLLMNGAESLISAWELLLPRLRDSCSGLFGAIERVRELQTEAAVGRIKAEEDSAKPNEDSALRIAEFLSNTQELLEGIQKYESARRAQPETLEARDLFVRQVLLPLNTPMERLWKHVRRFPAGEPLAFLRGEYEPASEFGRAELLLRLACDQLGEAFTTRGFLPVAVEGWSEDECPVIVGWNPTADAPPPDLSSVSEALAGAVEILRELADRAGQTETLMPDSDERESAGVPDMPGKYQSDANRVHQFMVWIRDFEHAASRLNAESDDIARNEWRDEVLRHYRVIRQLIEEGIESVLTAEGDIPAGWMVELRVHVDALRDSAETELPASELESHRNAVKQAVNRLHVVKDVRRARIRNTPAPPVEPGQSLDYVALQKEWSDWHVHCRFVRNRIDEFTNASENEVSRARARLDAEYCEARNKAETVRARLLYGQVHKFDASPAVRQWLRDRWKLLDQFWQGAFQDDSIRDQVPALAFAFGYPLDTIAPDLPSVFEALTAAGENPRGQEPRSEEQECDRANILEFNALKKEDKALWELATLLSNEIDKPTGISMAKLAQRMAEKHGRKWKSLQTQIRQQKWRRHWEQSPGAWNERHTRISNRGANSASSREQTQE